MKKLLLTIIFATFITTALADKNLERIKLEYLDSEYEDKFLNSKGSDNNIKVKILLSNSSKIEFLKNWNNQKIKTHVDESYKLGIWRNKNKYNHDTLKIDRDSYGISFENQTKAKQESTGITGLGLTYIDLGLLKSDYHFTPASVKNSSSIYSYNGKEIYNGKVFRIGTIGEMGFGDKYYNLTGKFGFEYSRNSYDSSKSIFTPEAESNVKLTWGVGKVFNFQKFKMQLGSDIKIIRYNKLYSKSIIKNGKVYAGGYEGISEDGFDIYIKFGDIDKTDYTLTLGLKSFEYSGSTQECGKYYCEKKPIKTGRETAYFNLGLSF